MNFQPNVDTSIRYEQIGGIMICGYNWGGNPNILGRGTSDSFFSDARYGNRYRNRIIEWFSLWGFPLARVPGTEGYLENSISQTNWLPTQTVSLHGSNALDSCISHAENFNLHLDYFKPKVLLLMGKALIDALNTPVVQNELIRIAGQPLSLDYLYDYPDAHNHKLKKFRVTFQKYEKMQVICFPHPTGSRGLSNDYIAGFRSLIEPIFKGFMFERNAG